MSKVMNRLLAALNAHDLDAFVACFAVDYRSEQPAHPSRAFEGNDKVRENWTPPLRRLGNNRRRAPMTASRSGNGIGGVRTPMVRRLPCAASQ